MKHTEEERIAWEEEFSMNWRKDRSIYYPKKKKNYSDGSDTSLEEKQHYGKKQYQKKNGNKKHNGNYTQQKKNTNHFEDFRSKENFENIGDKNHDFFETTPSIGESRFLKFFSTENSNENPRINTNNTANDSNKSVYKYFPAKENQPLMEIQNFFSNPSSSNNQNMEAHVKRVGFHNEKKGSQNMRNQNQTKHIEVL